MYLAHCLFKQQIKWQNLVLRWKWKANKSGLDSCEQQNGSYLFGPSSDLSSIFRLFTLCINRSQLWTRPDTLWESRLTHENFKKGGKFLSPDMAAPALSDRSVKTWDKLTCQERTRYWGEGPARGRRLRAASWRSFFSRRFVSLPAASLSPIWSHPECDSAAQPWHFQRLCHSRGKFYTLTPHFSSYSIPWPVLWPGA